MNVLNIVNNKELYTIAIYHYWICRNVLQYIFILYAKINIENYSIFSTCSTNVGIFLIYAKPNIPILKSSFDGLMSFITLLNNFHMNQQSGKELLSETILQRSAALSLPNARDLCKSNQLHLKNVPLLPL